MRVNPRVTFPESTLELPTNMAAGEIDDDEPAAPDQVSSVKQIFLDKYRENIEKGLYDDRDLEKIRTDDFLLELYCKHIPKAKPDEVASLINDSLKWRLEYQMNDMSDESFEEKIWEQGAIFYHNTDKDGHKVLIIRVKLHRKGDSQYLHTVKRFFAWHIEKVFREKPGEPVVMLFDMYGAGLGNLDMDFIKFCINCFKYNYPCILALMLVYEMPWIFNAAWKIIKTWLSPEAVQKIKFVDKLTIQEFISRDQLMEQMGGTEKFQYSYSPPSTMYSEVENNSSSKLSPDGVASTKKALGPLDKRTNNKDNCFRSRLLQIRPAEELCFQIEENVKEIFSTISLSNTLNNPVAYKVKTTSPEKFRVRPSGGLVMPGSPVIVFVHIQPGFEHHIHSDKFLVRAIEVTDESKDVTEMWKTVHRESIMEHRLRCILNSEPVRSKPTSDINILTEKIEALQLANQRIECRIQQIMFLHVFFLLVVILAIASDYWHSSPSGNLDQKSKYCTQ